MILFERDICTDNFYEAIMYAVMQYEATTITHSNSVINQIHLPKELSWKIMASYTQNVGQIKISSISWFSPVIPARFDAMEMVKNW